jgi:hypothetical protein
MILLRSDCDASLDRRTLAIVRFNPAREIMVIQITPARVDPSATAPR